MKRFAYHLTNIGLWLILLGSFAWGVIAPGMQALIGLIGAVIAAILLIVHYKPDFFLNY